MSDNYTTGYGGIKVDMNVTGLDGVLEVLQQLPPEVVSTRGGPVVRALRKAAVVIKEQAQATVVRRTGALANALMVSRGRRLAGGAKGERYIVWMGKFRRKYANTRKNRNAGLVGKRYEVDGPQFYGRFLEYGTSKMSAKPFLRPAVAARGQQAINVFERELRAGVDAVVRKLAAGARKG